MNSASYRCRTAACKSGRVCSRLAALCGIVFNAGLINLAANVNANASEYGVSSYRPGQIDLFAGYLAPPGSVLIKTYFLYQDASTTAFTDGGHVKVSSHTVSYTSVVYGAYITRLRLLASYWGFGAIEQSRIASQSLRVGPPGRSPTAQTDTVGGFGDLILAPLMLNWEWQQFHLVSAFLFYTPTGSYDPHRIIDVGLNRWALETDAGFTWMDEDSGRQVSVFTGYTINRTNGATDYHSGDELHFDFVAAQHLPRAIVLGMAGYALQQVSADSGSGATFGAYRGRVLALGPLIGKTIAFWKLPINFTFKYEFEFAAQNRLSGDALWLTASTRF